MSHSSHFAIDVPDSLIQRAKRGDGKAFEQIYRWFERPIYTLGLRLCGQPSEAQEVLQDSMIKVMTKIGEFKGQSPFWGWLRQIAVNEALMRLRRTSKTYGDEDVYEMDLADGNALLPPQAAEAAQLLAAMQQLPDITRSVLWLYHMEGYNHEEIAVQMGKSVSFSKSQLSRGTKKLRDLLIEPQAQG
ncbi:MAG: sigma-70 family RNA polymerase sigma factor [Arenimonas sp.]|nr:sigma-70 family RNA polymerase sigma factor [Arenimonas sp.]MBP7917082.1 sigma-70 family RNA polymerase sigma factor [Arenimonas sp.]